MGESARPVPADARVALLHRPETRAVAALAILVAWLFREALAGGVFYRRDIHLVWHARIEAFVRAVLAGSWPVWDPTLGFGRPLLADPSAQVLYPLTWLNLVLRPWTYYSLFAIVHTLGSAVGLFFLARRLRLSTTASFLSAALWMLSGPHVSGVDLWHHFAGVSWMPWVALAADRALALRTSRATLVWGALQGLQILAGSADACTMTGLVVITLAASRHVAWSRTALRADLALVGRAVLALAIAAALACGLWLPALEQVVSAARADLPSEIRTYWSVHPLTLLETIFPALFTSLPLTAAMRTAFFESREPFLASLYLGAGSVALVLAALGGSGHRQRFAFAALAAASVAIALGSHAPFYGWATTLVPPLRILRYPVKMMVLCAFAWSLLAGMGFDEWRRAGPTSRRSRWVVAGALLLFALLAAVGAATILWRPEDVARALLELPPGLTAARALASTRARLTVVAALVLILAFLSGKRGSGAAAALAPIVGALAFLDLAAFHRFPNPTAPRTLYTFRPPVLDQLTGSDPRIYVYDYSVPGKARQYLGRESAYGLARQPEGWSLDAASALALQMYLAPESGGRFGLRGSFEIDYRGLFPRDLELFTRLLRRVEGTDLHLRFLRLGGVTNVVALHAEGFEGLEPITDLQGLFAKPIRVFRVPSPLPRTYAVARAQGVEGSAALAAMTSPDFDPSTEVVLSGGDAASPTSSGFTGQSRVVAARADRVSIEADLSAPGYVVLLDGYDPGWKASVDGQPATLLRANVGFRAVRVEAGRHSIEQVYRPRAVLWGLGISLASAVALLAALALPRRKKRGPQEPPASS